MVPGWLEALSIVFVVLSILCALWIAVDLLRHPQRMWIMDLVWPLTALFSGPFGLWAYHAIGQKSARKSDAARREEEVRRERRAPADPAFAAGKSGRHQLSPDGRGGGGGHGTPKKPFWQVALTGSTHCGAGCAVGDFVGEWLVFATGGFILGSTLGTKYVVAFVLAYVVGIFFQYFSIAPMRGLGLWDGLWAAIQADTLSLTAYEVGMFAWMAVVQKLLFPGLEPTSWTFWFMMQIAMMLGLATTFPVNWWLIRRGIKEAM